LAQHAHVHPTVEFRWPIPRPRITQLTGDQATALGDVAIHRLIRETSAIVVALHDLSAPFRLLRACRNGGGSRTHEREREDEKTKPESIAHKTSTGLCVKV
jgi:hypothetical protein